MQRNPKHGHFTRPEGYKDVGYVNSGEGPEIKECYKRQHKRDEYDNSLYMHRGTDIITICHECKIVWHTDMSD